VLHRIDLHFLPARAQSLTSWKFKSSATSYPVGNVPPTGVSRKWEGK
jgi:hypothetical protein